MNFFERQQVARRNSRWLVVLFMLAVACIAFAVDVAARGAWVAFALYMENPSGGSAMPGWLHGLALGGTATLILAVSVRKTMEMGAGGGIAVARMMDARQVVPLRATEKERQLLNVVEEMAIASGTRVPIVYVLDAHRGINAFAAGGEGSLPVVVVTRGCVAAMSSATS